MAQTGAQMFDLTDELAVVPTLELYDLEDDDCEIDWTLAEPTHSTIQEEEDEVRESPVDQKLTSLTIRKVIIMVFATIMVLPQLSVDTLGRTPRFSTSAADLFVGSNEHSVFFDTDGQLFQNDEKTPAAHRWIHCDVVCAVFLNPDKKRSNYSTVSLLRDTTLNFLSSDHCNVLTPLAEGGLQFILVCSRANVGAQSGRYYMFEVKLIGNPMPLVQYGREKAGNYMKIGFSTSAADLFAVSNEHSVYFDTDGPTKAVALQKSGAVCKCWQASTSMCAMGTGP